MHAPPCAPVQVLTISHVPRIPLTLSATWTFVAGWLWQQELCSLLRKPLVGTMQKMYDEILIIAKEN